MRQDAEAAVLGTVDNTLFGQTSSSDFDVDDEDMRADEWEDIGGPHPHVRYADGIVPDEVRASLMKHLDELAALPDKDFHPGTEGKVLTLFWQPLTFRFKI